jgi:hypothetical protein
LMIEVVGGWADAGRDPTDIQTAPVMRSRRIARLQRETLRPSPVDSCNRLKRSSYNGERRLGEPHVPPHEIVKGFIAEDRRELEDGGRGRESDVRRV